MQNSTALQIDFKSIFYMIEIEKLMMQVFMNGLVNWSILEKILHDTLNWIFKLGKAFEHVVFLLMLKE